MSFGIIYGEENYKKTTITPEVAASILRAIDNGIDLTKFHLNNVSMNFDIEEPPPAVPNYISKKKLLAYEALHKKSAFEFINTILWEFLYTNTATKEFIDLMDQIIQLQNDKHTQNESAIEHLFASKKNFKSFNTFKIKLLKKHGIDFDEYKASKIQSLKKLHQRKTNELKIIYCDFKYQLPILKKLSQPLYIEIYPDMQKDMSLKIVSSLIDSNRSSIMDIIPSKNTVSIMHDALILYKYLQHSNNIYEKAIRYFNFHLLQTFGILQEKKHYVSMADQKNGKFPVCNIETGTKFELRKQRAEERKKIIVNVANFLELPNIGQ